MNSIKAESEKDIKECISLVGWDSNNFHTLKSTVEKFHKRLYKIVKNYNDSISGAAQMSLISVYQQRLLFEDMDGI
jgi:midasin (ATPase involved in ribosome maturation)